MIAARLSTRAKLVLALLAAAALAVIATPHDGAAPAPAAGPTPQQQARQQALEGCTQRGMAYYQQLGAYPKLSDGRLALDVIRDRCRETDKAF